MTCLLGARFNHRRGVTLVELLIVIGITSLIAAVALPSVKTLLKDRKTNQAAIQVRGFIE
ncbi:MAG: Tfp pilus assembly protein FimT/FimU, partial [Pirellulaceae bacterium]